MSIPTPADFMARAGRRPAPLTGSSDWAVRYASELRTIVTDHARRAPRNVQVHLGPSEIGVECDRQVVGKLLQLPTTNHVSDPWPSIVGTAVHAWLADCFTAYNSRYSDNRFLAEFRVVPHPEHSGTADLYDSRHRAVTDHKVLGPTSRAKVTSGNLPIKYVIQLLLYARGYRNLGLPVDRVALAAYPRTESSLSGLYVWDREYTPEDDALIDKTFQRMDQRKLYAHAVRNQVIGIADVPTHPDDTECYFCPFYRPESSGSSVPYSGVGCPGTKKPQP